MDSFELGSAPWNEDECVQIEEDENYLLKMKEECERFKRMLENRFSGISDLVEVEVKKTNHEFGEYYEVMVNYDENNQESLEIASLIERHLPAVWQDDKVFTYEDMKRIMKEESGGDLNNG